MVSANPMAWLVELDTAMGGLPSFFTLLTIFTVIFLEYNRRQPFGKALVGASIVALTVSMLFIGIGIPNAVGYAIVSGLLIAVGFVVSYVTNT